MTGPEPHSPTAVIESFLEMMSAEKGAAKNTIDAYRRDLDDFAAFLGNRHQALITAVPRDIGAYLQHISQAGLATTSRARRLSSIRQLYRFMVNDEIINEDPTVGFAGPRRERPLPKVLSIAEVERLLNGAARRIDGKFGRERVRALRLNALLEVLYATGMRVSELVGLPRSVLDGDDRMLTITGKGGRQRIVPLNTEARAALQRYLNIGQRRR